jgi:hypothetical protein
MPLEENVQVKVLDDGVIEVYTAGECHGAGYCDLAGAVGGRCLWCAVVASAYPYG